MGRTWLLFGVLIALLAAPGSAAGAKKKPDYSKSAATIAKRLAAANTDAAARAQLLAAFRRANVTVLTAKRGKRRVLVRGFARSTRDFFLTEPQVGGLARLARRRSQVPMSRFAAGLSQLVGGPVSAEQAAEALAAWISEAREGKRRDPSVFVPRLIDGLAKTRGSDLAAATGESKLTGIEIYLAGMTFAPARPRGRSGTRATAAAISCRELNEGSGIGSWLARSLARKLVSLVDSVLPAGITVQGLSQAAVALATDVRVAPGSDPATGAPPVHWRHYDRSADVRRFKLEFVSDLPVPDSLSQCLKLAGLDVPPAGGRRPDVPVIWWLDDGVPTAPEMLDQTLRQQGEWKPEGPSSSLSMIADLVSGLTGGRLVGSSASDAGGVATMRFTPRDEDGPYPGAADHIRGELLAIPLTAGTDRGFQQIANVFSAVARNVTFQVDVEHHVKIGWRFARPTDIRYTTPCEDEECPVNWHITFTAFRCLARAELRPYLDPATPADRPVGIAGQWHGIPGAGTLAANGSAQPWHPLFRLAAEPGGRFGIGNHETGTPTPEDGSIHMFRREADTPDAGHLTVEHFNDYDGTSETPFSAGPEEPMDVVPLKASEIPPSFSICETKEKLPAP